ILFVVELAQRLLEGAVSHEILVAEEVVARPVEAVRPAAGDRVDPAPGEAAQAYVVGGDHELNLLDRIQADRVGARLAARGTRAGEAEEVVVDRPVDLDVVVAVIFARHGEPALTL